MNNAKLCDAPVESHSYMLWYFEQVRLSEAGTKIYMLTITCMDKKWSRRIVNMSYAKKEKKTTIKKHITFKLKWNLAPLNWNGIWKGWQPGEYQKDSKISLKYMEMERYEKYLTYFGGQERVGQSLTVDMTKARTVEPYLVGKRMTEEVENHSHVPLKHGSFPTGFASTQTNKQYWKHIIKQGTMPIVEEYQQKSITTTTTDKGKIYKVYCDYCDKNHRSWFTIKEDTLQFIESEHDLLAGNGIPSAPANLRRKEIYCNMALKIAVGATGKGACMELPICVLVGACDILADDGKCMSHMENWRGGGNQ
jgi:hypothetical protein